MPQREIFRRVQAARQAARNRLRARDQQILQVVPMDSMGPQPVRFSIASQSPVFVPTWRIVSHSSESAQFVSTGD